MITRRMLYWNAVEGRYSIMEQREEDRITDNEVDYMEIVRARWLADAAGRIARERREKRINTALGVLCFVAVGVLIAIAIGVLR
jgi:hypothetical protein